MGILNECIPFYEPGARLTASCEAAVTGKRLVDISDPIQSGPGLSSTSEGGNLVVSHATAAGKVLGVASHDAAIGAKVTVICEGVVPIKAGGNIATGAEVEVGTNGQAVTLDSGKAVGRCLSAATSGADAMIRLYNN